MNASDLVPHLLLCGQCICLCVQACLTRCQLSHALLAALSSLLLSLNPGSLQSTKQSSNTLYSSQIRSGSDMQHMSVHFMHV